MLLDWDSKISELLEHNGVEPYEYNGSPELKEVVAKYFRFKDFATFQLLPEPKKVIEGLSMDMLPDHKNYEYMIASDCVELIENDFMLYNNIENTTRKMINLLQFIKDNFSDETIIACIENIRKTVAFSKCEKELLQNNIWNELIGKNGI